MRPADGERRTVILVEEKPGLWMALTEDRSEYIYDPEYSTPPFPQLVLAGWSSAEAAHADLTRWGFLVVQSPLTISARKIF